MLESSPDQRRAIVKSDFFFEGFRGDRVAWMGADLEDLLGRAVERARGAWPQLVVSDGDFLRHLGARIDPAPEEPAALLVKLHLGDLYLACACSIGVPGAATVFVRDYLQDLPRYLARLDPSPTLLEEVHQELSERLLVAAAPAVPRIATYNGRGALVAWVGVSAQRIALNFLARRSQDRARPAGDALERRLAESANPEVLLVKAHLRDGLQAALRHALSALSARDRTLLRLSVIGGVGCRKLAEMYGVNFATASRWLVKVRGSLLASVQAFLQHERGIESGGARLAAGGGPEPDRSEPLRPARPE